MTNLTRRNFIRLAGAGAATAVLAACNPNATTSAPTSASETALPTTSLPQVTLPAPTTIPSADFMPDVEIALQAVEDTAVIFPNITTTVWRIRGELLQGNANALQAIPDSYLGPTLRLRKGQ